jgi:hypothetical protein
MSIGTRLAIAFVLGLIAAVGVPQPKQAAPTFLIDVSDDMKTKVADVARALKAASPAERAIWASVWEKAAVVVAGDAVTTEVIFTDTRSLRGFTVLSLDIAWRRLGGVKAGQYPGLREAVEKAMTGVVGLDVKPVDADLRRAYGEACRAIAWAGYGNGG